MVNAFVLVKARPARIAGLAEELAATEGIAEVYSVAGDLADLVVVVRVRAHEDLAKLVTGRIATMAGVDATTTLVAFQAYSRKDLEAIWDLGSR